MDRRDVFLLVTIAMIAISWFTYKLGFNEGYKSRDTFESDYELEYQAIYRRGFDAGYDTGFDVGYDAAYEDKK